MNDKEISGIRTWLCRLKIKQNKLAPAPGAANGGTSEALQRQGQWVDGFWMQKIDSLNPGIEDMRGQSADNGFNFRQFRQGKYPASLAAALCAPLRRQHR